MSDDTEARKNQTVPFMLRQVTVPSWVGVVFIATWLYCLINLLVTDALLFTLALIGMVALTVFVRNPLRRRAGQDPEEDARMVEEAPTQEEAARLTWLQQRTFQVWHLILISLATAGFLLDLVGVI